jgi:hypothetical protein
MSSGLGRHTAQTVFTDRRAEQGNPITQLKHIERQRVDIIQARQPAAAGHQQQAALRTGQQRRHLRLTRGIVEHDKDLPAGQQAAVQRGPVLEILRDLLIEHTKGTQNPIQRVTCVDRGYALTKAMQVEEQLPVRVVARKLVRSVHCEGVR